MQQCRRCFAGATYCKRNRCSAIRHLGVTYVVGSKVRILPSSQRSQRPEFVDTLVEFVRGRPAQRVDGFLAQLDAVVAHDAGPALAKIRAPTLITFGARDLVCSTRFAGRLHGGIAGSELVVFEHLSHAGLHEDRETFNRATLDFLLRQLP